MTYTIRSDCKVSRIFLAVEDDFHYSPSIYRSLDRVIPHLILPRFRLIRNKTDMTSVLFCRMGFLIIVSCWQCDSARVGFLSHQRF